MQLHQQKGMISLSPPTICNSAEGRDPVELDDEIIEAMRFVAPPPEAPVNNTNREKYSCPVCHINLW
ncbi:hypothetical protein ACOIB2_26875, partial [Klebsiella pneumoniae]